MRSSRTDDVIQSAAELTKRMRMQIEMVNAKSGADSVRSLDRLRWNP